MFASAQSAYLKRAIFDQSSLEMAAPVLCRNQCKRFELMAPLRPRHRKRIASVALIFWLFAVCVGVVNGCALEEAFTASHQVTGASNDQGQDDGTPPGCEQFCVNDAPVPTKCTLVHDQPGEQAALFVAIWRAPVVAAAALPISLHDRPHPSLGVSLYTRFLRLAL